MIAMLVCLLAMLALQILTPYWWWVMIVPFAFGAAGGDERRTGPPDGRPRRGASLARRGHCISISREAVSSPHGWRGCSGWESRGR